MRWDDYEEPPGMMQEVAYFLGREHSSSLILGVSLVDLDGTQILPPIHTENDAQRLLNNIYQNFNIASIEGFNWDESGLCIERTPRRIWHRKLLTIEEMTDRLYSDPSYDLARRNAPRDAQTDKLRVCYQGMDFPHEASDRSSGVHLILDQVVRQSVNETYASVYGRRS